MKAFVRLNPCGEIAVPSSKSEVHRLLICAALCRSETVIECKSICRDTQATVRCLCALGADIKYDNGCFSVRPITEVKNGALLDCGESGSTLRFLLPVASALGGGSFTGCGRLPMRPLGALTEAMKKHGISFTASMLPLSVSGKLGAGEYVIPGSVSSQFISGLCFALPLLKEDSRIVIDGEIQSLSYIKMTLDALKAFGVVAVMNGNTVNIRGGGEYVSPGRVKAGGDWSNSAFFLCAGALKGSVTVKGLDMDSLSGDKKIIELLKSAGAEVMIHTDGITVTHKPLHGFTVDCADIPDLVPPLCVLAAGADGESRFYNAYRLRLKESDRIEACEGLINSLGGRAYSTADSLVVIGTGSLNGGGADGCGDHRIVMAAALAACLCKNGVMISGADDVNKSYPDFFDDLTAAGGKITFSE